ncbi:hypothetical protein D915_006676 [Fasciola hepatica]|uniref:THIF-type NAD/FAD binding fold domain-containing protein n=1 Tax=Fasciola hepatica TaxID=6192 RepID=A0A4E0RZP5_FASHE|nr:hypothetical protein D915_006676 [Fasciola hepatica]
MKQLCKSDVFIYRVDGLDWEIAKNITLAGVRSVSLYDPKPITWAGLSTHFYADPDRVGMPRAQVSRGKLAARNSHVVVRMLPSASFPEPFGKDFVT